MTMFTNGDSNRYENKQSWPIKKYNPYGKSSKDLRYDNGIALGTQRSFAAELNLIG